MEEELEIKRGSEVLKSDQSPAKEVPSIDVKYNQGIGLIQGELLRNWSYEDGKQDEDLNIFIQESMDGLKRLSSPKGLRDVRQFNETEDLANGLALLVDRFGRTKIPESQLNGLSEKEMDEVKRMNVLRSNVFLSTAQKLFPEIKAPTSKFEMNQDLEELAKSLKNVSSFGKTLRADIEDIEKADNKDRITKIDNFIISASDSIMNSGNFGQVKTQDQKLGVSEASKSDVIDFTKLIYHLQLIRNQLQKEVYGRENVSKEEATEIDSVRKEINK